MLASSLSSEIGNEKNLPQQADSGILQEFWQQWANHREALYRYCLRLMNSNPIDAEDILSQAMLKAWEKVQKFAEKIDNFKAWLMQLTRNLCIDVIRERSRGPLGVEDIERSGTGGEIETASLVETPEQALERSERSLEIRRAIADLPQKLRDTFVLHFYEDLTNSEIAERQGISYDTVCKRISRARKKLKEKLSDYFRGEEKVGARMSAWKQQQNPLEFGEKQKGTGTAEGDAIKLHHANATELADIEAISPEKSKSLEDSDETNKATGEGNAFVTEDVNTIAPEQTESANGSDRTTGEEDAIATEPAAIESAEAIAPGKPAWVESCDRSKDLAVAKIAEFIPVNEKPQSLSRPVLFRISTLDRAKKESQRCDRVAKKDKKVNLKDLKAIAYANQKPQSIGKGNERSLESRQLFAWLRLIIFEKRYKRNTSEKIDVRNLEGKRLKDVVQKNLKEVTQMYSKTTLKQLWKQVRVALLSIALAFGLAFPALAVDKSCELDVQMELLPMGATWDSETPVYWFEVSTQASNCEWTAEVDNYDGLLAVNDRGTSQTDVYFQGPNAEDVRVNNPCVEPMIIEYCPLYPPTTASAKSASAESASAIGNGAFLCTPILK